jgi:hypothetical protein
VAFVTCIATGRGAVMRRVLVILCAGLVFGLVIPTGASATPNQQLVAGTGTVMGFGNPMVHVNAQSDQGGGNPRGHFWIRYPSGVEFGGRVVCLTAVANNAGLTGRIEVVKVANPAAGFVEGNYLRVRITDFGEPGTADLVNFDPGSPTLSGSCAGVGDLPISQGNYIVHDDLLDLSAFDLLLGQFEAAADDPYGSG